MSTPLITNPMLGRELILLQSQCTGGGRGEEGMVEEGVESRNGDERLI